MSECPPFDVVIPSVNNASCLQRAVISLIRNTDPTMLGKVILVGQGVMGLADMAQENEKIVIVDTGDERLSWIEAMKRGAQESDRPVLLCIHDDVIILPGHPGWLQEMAYPFTQDDMVAMTACPIAGWEVNFCQSVRACFPPGAYYTTFLVPIVIMVAREAFLQSLSTIPEDLFCDQEVSLNLMENGWKLVLVTTCAQYHEGYQTNGRVYGGEDPKGWMDVAAKRIKEELPTRHNVGMIRRLERCEMVPMQNYYQRTSEGVRLRRT